VVGTQPASSPPSRSFSWATNICWRNSSCAIIRALCCRLSAHHLLSPWIWRDPKTYLTTGLQAVGFTRNQSLEPARRRPVGARHGGVPRSVCLLARAAWLEAARAEAREIGAPTMQLAMEQVPGLLGLTRPNS